MATKHSTWENGYDQGWDAGRRSMQIEMSHNAPLVQQQFYDLNPHDLDTLAMGIALLILHAADIETIAATMGIQTKLGIAEKTLGWLHCICTNATEYTRQFSLRDGELNPWLNPDIMPGWEQAAAQQFEKPEFPNGEFGKPKEADNDIPF